MQTVEHVSATYLNEISSLGLAMRNRYESVETGNLPRIQIGRSVDHLIGLPIYRIRAVPNALAIAQARTAKSVGRQ